MDWNPISGLAFAKRAACTMLCTVAAACTPFPGPVEVPQLGVAKVPEIQIDPETGRQFIDIDVLIYNVWGLPWPVPRNSRRSLTLIGQSLNEMRSEGLEPDIVLLQEAFTMRSQPILNLGGYPNVVGGPELGDPAERLKRDEAPQFYDARSIWKGEKLGKWLNSGLAILSNFPIEESHRQPFRRGACAGFDCMSNKGMLLAVIRIPGVPEPIEVFNTHMNSNDASGVPPERSRVAHILQSDEVRDFLSGEINDDRRALIVGGDFNTKEDRDRL